MVHCWISRHEADGFDSWLDWVMASEERCRIYAEHYYDENGPSDPTGGHDICLLEDGHRGPHEFTPAEDIVIRFAPREVS